MFLIPRIGLHTLVALDVLEDDLTKAVEVCNVTHLGIEQLRHQLSSLERIVNLQYDQYAYVGLRDCKAA